MTLDQLKRVFDDLFGEPHLARGHVHAAFVQSDVAGSKCLKLKIGRRTVWFTEVPGALRVLTHPPARIGTTVERDTSGEQA